MLNTLLKKRELVLAVLIVILSLVTNAINPNFLTVENITDLLKAFTVLGIFSLGVLVVIVSGGFDVSFTAIATVTQYAVVAILIHYNTGNIYVSIIGAMVLGTILGLLNGAIIHFYKMPAIIVTIATQSLFHGTLYVITQGAQINDIPGFFWNFSDAKIGALQTASGAEYGLSVVTLLWIILGLLLYLILKYHCTRQKIPTSTLTG